MRKPTILAVVPFTTNIEKLLDNNFEVIRPWRTNNQQEILCKYAQKIRGVATDGHAGADKNLINKLPSLEIISCYGVGYDAIDLATARERSIVVTNTPNVLNDAVAELTIGLMVGLCRQIPKMHEYVCSGQWGNKKELRLGTQLAGSRAGILGLGRIGQEIANRLLPFKMQVSYYGRTEQKNVDFEYFSDLCSMASKIDWLIVAAPATPQTKHIVNRDVLTSLGELGYLINVSRGSLVDETALSELLQSGGIGGAALDVFSDEPRVPESIRKSKRVLLTPHIGSATYETREAMGQLVVRNLSRKFQNKPVVTQVNA